MLTHHVLTWQGTEYKLQPRRQMEAIRAIEEHLTRRQIMGLMLEPDPKLGALASAWCAVLRMAGASVTVTEAYQVLAANAENPDDFWSVPYVVACADLLRILLLPKQWADFKSTLEQTLALLTNGEALPAEEQGALPLAEEPEAEGPTKSPATALH